MCYVSLHHLKLRSAIRVGFLVLRQRLALLLLARASVVCRVCRPNGKAAQRNLPSLYLPALPVPYINALPLSLYVRIQCIFDYCHDQSRWQETTTLQSTYGLHVIHWETVIMYKLLVVV